MTHINCNGCRKCCQGGNAATLRPEQGDNVTLYKTRQGARGTRILRQRKNGDCVYLGPKGCRIHDDPLKPLPYECRTFDCRTFFLQSERDPEVFMERLHGPAREALLEGRFRVRQARGAVNQPLSEVL